MNNTNRGLNRAFSFIVGLLFLVIGVGAVLLGSVPSFRSGWKGNASHIQGSVAQFYAAPTVAGTQISWWAIASLVVLAVIVILLVTFIFRQGHGHTARFVENARDENGETIVDSRVAEQLLQDALDSHQELVSCHVSTYEIRSSPVLKISATARRGVSPKDVVETVEQSLSALESLFGMRVLASIQVSGGFRTRVAGATRLQ